MIAIVDLEHDPEKFLTEISVAYDEKHLPKPIRKVMTSNIAAAYFIKGEIDCATEIWNNLLLTYENNKQQKKWMFTSVPNIQDYGFKALLNYYICKCHLEQGNIEQANKYYENLLIVQDTIDSNIFTQITDWNITSTL